MLVLSANKKEPEITIALPYYEKDGVMVYAEFDYITYDSAGMSTKSNLLDLENHKDTGGSYLNGFNFEQKVNADLTVTLKWINPYLLCFLLKILVISGIFAYPTLKPYVLSLVFSLTG